MPIVTDAASVLLRSLPQNFFHLLFCHRQIVGVGAQPCGEILLDRVRPGGVDLARGVLAFLQTQVAKRIPQARQLGGLARRAQPVAAG